MVMQRSFQLPYPLIPYPARSIHPAGSPAAQPPRQPKAFGGDGAGSEGGAFFKGSVIAHGCFVSAIC